MVFFSVISDLLKQITDFLNGVGDQIVSFVLGWLDNLPPMLQGLVVIFGALLIVVGLITLIKKSIKLIISLAIFGAIAFAVYYFVLK